MQEPKPNPFLHPPIYAKLPPPRPLTSPALFELVNLPFRTRAPPRRGFCCIWDRCKTFARGRLGLNFVRFHIVNYQYPECNQWFDGQMSCPAGRGLATSPHFQSRLAADLLSIALQTRHFSVEIAPQHRHRPVVPHVSKPRSRRSPHVSRRYSQTRTTARRSIPLPDKSVPSPMQC